MKTRNGVELGVWELTDEESYEWSFECLPPAKMWSGGFMVGEPFSTTQETGEVVWRAFVKQGRQYFKALVTESTLAGYLAELAQRK